MSTRFIAAGEWIRETDARSSSSSLAGELFFALPEIREATQDELDNDDTEEAERALWRRRKRRQRRRP